MFYVFYTSSIYVLYNCCKCMCLEYIYQINSTDEFLDIVRTTNARGTLASLDVESLFTNVPLATTIEIICDCMYNHVELPPPIIERKYSKTAHSRMHHLILIQPYTSKLMVLV